MEEIGVSATAIESLERDFQNVINELGGEDNLERFRLEYEKLHRALKKSHESEKRLIKKCQELSQEIMANAAKVQSAIKLSQGDFATIEALKKEIEKAWKMVDTAHEKESRSKETIQQLKREATTLQQLVEQGTALTQGHEVTLAELTNEKKELMREQDELLHKIEGFSREIRDNHDKIRTTDTDHQTRLEEVKKLNDKYSTMSRDYEREVKSHDRAEAQCKELMSVLQVRNNELDIRRRNIDKFETKLSQLSQQFREDSQNKEQLIEKLRVAEKTLNAAKDSCASEQATNVKMKKELATLDVEIKKQDDRIHQLRHEETKSAKARDQQQKEIKRLDQAKDDIKREHEMLDRQLVNIKKQLEAIKRERKQLDGTGHQMDLEQKSLEGKTAAEREKQQRVIQLLDNEGDRKSVV